MFVIENPRDLKLDNPLKVTHFLRKTDIVGQYSGNWKECPASRDLNTLPVVITAGGEDLWYLPSRATACLHRAKMQVMMPNCTEANF